MSANASDGTRYAPGGVARDGSHQFHWNLTSKDLTDPVQLVLPPEHVLPVVFVPGIMGSNLADLQGNSIWNLDTTFGIPLGLAGSMVFKSAGDRQKLLKPDLVKVDPSGNVPSKLVGSITDPNDYRHRGWGEIAEGSYQAFLLWLEDHLNGQGYNPAEWKDFYYVAVSATPKPGEPLPEPKLYPGITMQMTGLPDTAEIGGWPKPVTSDDLLKRAGFRMPVYACGYNWLANNLISALRLKNRIDDIIAENNKGRQQCEQVVIVTHSMGGLVARACQMLTGMEEKVAGIVHGVMPTTGAAVAYRRCKVGMRDEDWKSGMVLGETGKAVTAVFAQAPGALELLPTAQYESTWLTFGSASGQPIASAQPTGGDPYQDIYLNKSNWWGLVRPEWLHPRGGVPIAWDVYKSNVAKASQFATAIKNHFHPDTYVFYGNDSEQASFQGIHWEVSHGIPPSNGGAPAIARVPDMGFDDVRASGNSPIYVGGKQVYQPSWSPYGMPTVYNTSYWDIQCAKQDSGGDGTVPIVSGVAPRILGGGAIKQQFGLKGFAHEGAYRDHAVQAVSLYGIIKIAATAKVPA